MNDKLTIEELREILARAIAFNEDMNDKRVQAIIPYLEDIHGLEYYISDIRDEIDRCDKPTNAPSA